MAPPRVYTKGEFGKRSASFRTAQRDELERRREDRDAKRDARREERDRDCGEKFFILNLRFELSPFGKLLRDFSSAFSNIVGQMSELPSYHHLSPEQIEGLSFRVTFRPLRSAVGDASGGELLSKEIVWQEKYPKVFGPPNEENQRVCIFTYTSADVVPYDGESSNCKKGDLHDANLVGQGFSLRNKPRVKHTYREKLNDMMLREEVMVIMAAVNCSTEYQEIVLCVIKLNPTGLVSSYPSISEVGTEDFEDTSVFMSRRSVDAVIGNGPRLLTYSFTLAKSLYEYTIEWNGARALLHDEPEVMIAEQHNIDKEAVDERRDLIRKEFDSFDCMYENEERWRNQAHIEIVSVDGFAESNMLLCMPLGSNFIVHYRVLKFGGQIKKGDVIMKGATSNVQSYSVCECLEFAAHFVFAFIGASFVRLDSERFFPFAWH